MYRSLIFCFAFGLLFASPLVAQAGAGGDFDDTYAGFDGVLRANVDGSGMVNYDALKSNAELSAFLKTVAETPAEEVGSWSRSSQIAFYTNAYNAITIKAILDASPVKSIKDIQPNVWDHEKWTVAGRTVSLNWIEHTKLRKNLSEPRVHFTLVCAAKGCPKLKNRAYTAGNIGAEMEAAAKAFFSDSRKNRVDAAGKKVYLSTLLDWYGDDFLGREGLPEIAGLDGLSAKQQATVRLFAKYLSDADRAALGAGGFSVAYNDYDWALNKQ